MRRYSWLYALILIVAFVLRAHQLTDYPPAINTDEAVNVIDGFQIARSGSFPLYEEDQGRPEPLYQLLMAAVTVAWGSSVWGMRLASVFLSLLTVAVIGWVTRLALRDLPATTRHVSAAGAMIALTVMIGDLTLSRTLYRTNLELLCVLLSMGFVLRALGSLRRRDFILGGIFGGLVLYTYTSGWAFPLGFAGLGITLILFQRRQWRRWLPGMLLFTLCAAVIAAPVVFLALTHPRAVFGRAQDVLGGGGNIIELILPAVRQFYQAGDVNPEYNVAAAPILSATFLPLFLIGLAGLIARLRTPSALFLLTLLAVFNLPVVLSNEIPHGLRVASEYVIVAIIIAVGIAMIFTLAKYLPLLRADPLRLRVALLALIALLLLHGQFAWGIYRDFWQHPDASPLWKAYGLRLDHNEWFFRTDREDFARWLNAQTTPILLPVDELQQANTRTWVLPTYPTVTTAGADFRLPPQTTLMIPWSLELGDTMTATTSFALLDHGVITLLPPLASATHDQLISLLPGGTPISR
ncbi:MAG: glycosyltransferase family 39 protein, partial [Chloroflexota bacterium]